MPLRHSGCTKNKQEFLIWKKGNAQDGATSDTTVLGTECWGVLSRSLLVICVDRPNVIGSFFLFSDFFFNSDSFYLSMDGAFLIVVVGFFGFLSLCVFFFFLVLGPSLCLFCVFFLLFVFSFQTLSEVFWCFRFWSGVEEGGLGFSRLSLFSSFFCFCFLRLGGWGVWFV